MSLFDRVFLCEMDERLRRIERAAYAGDPEAAAHLDRMRVKKGDPKPVRGAVKRLRASPGRVNWLEARLRELMREHGVSDASFRAGKGHGWGKNPARGRRPGRPRPSKGSKRGVITIGEPYRLNDPQGALDLFHNELRRILPDIRTHVSDDPSGSGYRIQAQLPKQPRRR